MVTLAFAFVVEHGAIEWRGFTGGANGIMGIPPVPVLGAALDARTLAAAIAVVDRGRRRAVLADEPERLGPRHARGARRRDRGRRSRARHDHHPLDAFVVSAAYAGVAGGLFAPLTGFVSPEAFPLITSIIFVLVVMVGGQGTIAGPLVGAAIVTLLPEVLSVARGVSPALRSACCSSPCC